jgi:hypothetical protein
LQREIAKMSEITPFNAKTQKMVANLLNKSKFKTWLLFKLPLGWFAGMRIEYLDGKTCRASIPMGWRSQNPFNSIYFAAEAMTAELSAGALGMIHIENSGEKVSLLVTGLEASFSKKAVAQTTFTCEDGDKIHAAIQETIRTGEGTTAECVSIGRMADGTEVARFKIFWSFKKKK